MKLKIAKTIEDINICYKLRELIFVQGQNVPLDRERDAEDETAVHFLLYSSEDLPIGVGRVVAENKVAIIGRLGIVEQSRGIGAGLFLMQNIINYSKEQEFEKIILGAQEHAINFYKKLGFEVISDKYMDAGIVHYKMQLNL